MNNIAFTGFLRLKDNKERNCLLNTNNIIGAYQSQNEDTISINSADGSKTELSGYKFAEVEKAIIKADEQGFYELNKTKNKEHAIETPKKEPVSDILSKPKENTKGDDIFDYISDELKGYGGALCPNSLNGINSDLRNNEHYYIDTDYSKRIIKACDEAFEILPPLEKEETFYRAVYGSNLPDEVLNAKEGDIITPDKGYAQVALDRYTASKYLPSKICKPILFEMTCPKGSKVSKTKSKLTGSGYPEGLIPKGQKFKITSKSIENMPSIGSKNSYNSVTVYKMEYVTD